MKIIIDDEILLELTAQKHAAQLFEAMDNNREHLAEFLPWVHNMQSVGDFERYIDNCEQLYRDKREVSFVIVANGRTVGRIGLHHWNVPNKTAAIGYWLDKTVTGKGIVVRSCVALINYGFRYMKLNRIEIKAAVTNIKSQAVPQKLRFTQEGILREAELVNGELLDLVLFSMLKREWANIDALQIKQ